MSNRLNIKYNPSGGTTVLNTVDVKLLVCIGYDATQASTVSIGGIEILKYDIPEKTKGVEVLEYTAHLWLGRLTFEAGYYLVPNTLQNLTQVFPGKDMLHKMFQRGVGVVWTGWNAVRWEVSDWGKELWADPILAAEHAASTGVTLDIKDQVDGEEVVKDYMLALTAEELELTRDYIVVHVEATQGQDIETEGNVHFVKILE